MKIQHKIISPYGFISEFFAKAPESYDICFDYYTELMDFWNEVNDSDDKKALMGVTGNQQLFSTDRFSEFMEVCKKIFLDEELKKQPDQAFMKWLEPYRISKPLLAAIKSASTVRECADLLKREKYEECRQALAVHYDKQAILKTEIFLKQMLEMAEDLYGESENQPYYRSIIANFHGVVRLFMHLFHLKLAGGKQPAETEKTLFRYVYNLMRMLENDGHRCAEGERPFNADSSSITMISDNEIDIAWERISVFCLNYNKDPKISGDLFRKFKDTNNEKTTFRCLFTIDGGDDEAVIQDCCMFMHFDSKPDRIPRIKNVVCMNLDASGKPITGHRMNKMLETAVKDALVFYANMKKSERIGYDHLYEIRGNIDTLFYSIGEDAFSWYEGESVGAASFCASLSALSGQSLASDTYYTGRTGNKGHENIGVDGIEVKFGAVRRQQAKKNLYKTFVIPNSNYRDLEFEKRNTRDDDKVVVKAYNNDHELFDLWHELSITDGIDKRTQAVKDEIEMLIFEQDSKAVEKSESDKLTDSLLHIISGIAPHQPIDLRLLEPGLEQIRGHVSSDILPEDDIVKLIRDMDNSLKASFEYLAENDGVWGTYNAIRTKMEVQLREHKIMGQPNVNQVNLIVSALFKGALEHDLFDHTIPDDKDRFIMIRKKLEHLIPHIEYIVSDSANNRRNIQNVTALIETTKDIQADLLISNFRNAYVGNEELIPEVDRVIKIGRDFVSNKNVKLEEISPAVQNRLDNLDSLRNVITENTGNSNDELVRKMVQQIVAEIRTTKGETFVQLQKDPRLYKLLSDLSYLTSSQNVSRGLALRQVLIDFVIYRVKLLSDLAPLNRKELRTGLKALQRLYITGGKSSPFLNVMIREVMDRKEEPLRRGLLELISHFRDNVFLAKDIEPAESDIGCMSDGDYSRTII